MSCWSSTWGAVDLLPGELLVFYLGGIAGLLPGGLLTSYLESTDRDVISYLVLEFRIRWSTTSAVMPVDESGEASI